MLLDKLVPLACGSGREGGDVGEVEEGEDKVDAEDWSVVGAKEGVEDVFKDWWRGDRLALVAGNERP